MASSASQNNLVLLEKLAT